MARSSVVIIGCGALGGNIANLLVRAGVGRVTIVDRDFVEYHNLQRQTLFDEDDVKNRVPKAVAAERHLRKINSSVEVKGIVADANYTNIEGFCRGADVILDGLDNPETRFLINDVSLKHNIPWVYGGAIASTGMTMTVVPGETPCFRCVFPASPGPGTVPTCETAGIIGPVSAVVSSLQATEAIKLLVGEKKINRGLVFVDVWKMTFDCISINSRQDCPACRGKYDFLEGRFAIKATSLCGQSRAVQIVDTTIKDFSLDRLAARLKHSGKVSRDEFALRFGVNDYEIIVFPDGRTLVRNSIDELAAQELYLKYIGNPPPG